VTVRAGVAGAARAVEETGGEEAVAVEDFGSGVAAANVAGGLFEIPECRADLIRRRSLTNSKEWQDPPLDALYSNHVHRRDDCHESSYERTVVNRPAHLAVVLILTAANMFWCVAQRRRRRHQVGCMSLRSSRNGAQRSEEERS
jgi:hypothetical protein